MPLDPSAGSVPLKYFKVGPPGATGGLVNRLPAASIWPTVSQAWPPVSTLAQTQTWVAQAPLRHTSWTSIAEAPGE